MPEAHDTQSIRSDTIARGSTVSPDSSVLASGSVVEAPSEVPDSITERAKDSAGRNDRRDDARPVSNDRALRRR